MNKAFAYQHEYKILKERIAALESENADLRLSIDDVIDFVSNLYPHLEDELRHRVHLIFADDDKE